MKTKIFLGTLLISISFQVLAFNASSYISSLKVGNSQGDMQVLGALEFCSSSRMSADCVIPQLKALPQNELATNILNGYAKTQAEGKFDKLPECQTQKHKDTNDVLGRCWLVMNMAALKDQNKDAAIQKYQTCLQGGLIGLAYDGNMSAQYLLSQIFKSTGVEQSAQVWEKSLEFKKGSEEDLLMRKCYM